MAASYTADNSDKLDGLIFLAAYSTKDLSDSDLKILSIYGSEDKVVNTEKIEQGRKLMPSDYEEFRIDGETMQDSEITTTRAVTEQQLFPVMSRGR